jgi:hypothetical protein
VVYKRFVRLMMLGLRDSATPCAGGEAMIHRIARYLVLTSVVVVLMPGVASAHTVEFDTDISATRRPGGLVESGTRVRIFGELSSPRRGCVTDSVVELHREGERIRSEVVGSDGAFSFRVRVSRTTRFRVVFNGKILNADHPHNHTCGPSSARVRVVTTSLVGP